MGEPPQEIISALYARVQVSYARFIRFEVVFKRPKGVFSMGDPSCVYRNIGF